MSLPKDNKEQKGAADATPPVTSEVDESQDPATPPADDTPSQEEGNNDNLDELGYEKISEEPAAPEGKEKSKVDPKKEDPAKEPAKVENPGTGYGDEPPKVEELPPDDKTPKEEPKEPDDFDKNIGELPKEEIAKVKDFATKYKLTAEQIKAYGDLRRAELKEFNAKVERRKKELEVEKDKTRAAWHKELKEDKDFGGEHFGKNVQLAERVLEDFMPGTKKHLTERGAMLPPYVMRDLAKLGEQLYATDKLVQGDPSVKDEPTEEVDDALAFYE